MKTKTVICKHSATAINHKVIFANDHIVGRPDEITSYEDVWCDAQKRCPGHGGIAGTHEGMLNDAYGQ